MKEIITNAAIWPIGAYHPTSLPRPARHSDIIHYLAQRGIGPEKVAGKTQGFMTSNNRFVNRLKARKIAIAAGQLLPTARKGSRLYSEDLW